MRIGEFAKSNNLSIDTVRYYVKLKLIHPIQKGKYYYFNKEQQVQLDNILYLKKLRFSLEEIKKILTTKEFIKIRTTIESCIYEQMLLKKKNDLTKEIKELSEVLNELESELKRVKEKRNHTYKESGIAFKSLDFLCCPNCGKDIEITEGTLKGNGIYEGKCDCTCGYSFSINEGIIVTKQNRENIIEPYEETRNFLNDFMNKVPKSYVDFMMHSYKEIARVLVEKRLSDKVLLFMKSGLGVLEISLLEHSQDIKLMILVDDDFNKLRIAKKSIETNFPGCNIIYICSEIFEVPIKKKTVDIAVDFLASFVNGFRLDDNMYEHLIPVFKEKSSIIGLYLYFKDFNMLSRLEEVKRKLFDGRTIPKSIRQNNYSCTSNYDEVILYEGENIYDFFQEGDKVHSKIMVFDRTDLK